VIIKQSTNLSLSINQNSFEAYIKHFIFEPAMLNEKAISMERKEIRKKNTLFAWM
jgi:hypothetical protein